MAKLDDIRRWARGKEVKGLPSDRFQQDVEKPNVQKGLAVGGGIKYKINESGDNILLQFGMFSGSTVGQLVRTPRGRKYLKWILSNDFPEDLKEVCKYHLTLWKRERRERKLEEKK